MVRLVKKLIGDNPLQVPIEEGFTDSDDELVENFKNNYIFLVDRADTERQVDADIAVVHDDKEQVDIVVDSGAAASSCNVNLLPEVTVVQGQTYNLMAAHGTKIEHYDHKDIRLVTEDGNGNDAHITSRYQATNVHKAIKSVYETTQFGNLAIFYNDGGDFVHVGVGNIEKAKKFIH